MNAKSRRFRSLSGNDRAGLWSLPLASWLGFFYLIPLLFIILTSFRTMVDYKLVNEYTLENYTRIFSNPIYLSALKNSLLLSLRVVVITTVIAYLLALALKYAIPSRLHTFFLVLIIAPFWTSYLIRAYSWFIILGNTGVMNGLLKSLHIIEQPLHILYTPTATIIGLVHYLLPLMTLNLFNAIDSIDDSILEAADDLGAGPVRKFFNIILPLSAPGLYSGLMFIFILAFADFVTPATLGGQMERVFPQLIVDAVQWNVDWPLAASLSVMMVAVICLILSVVSLLRNIGNREMGGSGK